MLTQCLSHRISFRQQLAVTFYSMFIPSYQFQPVVSSHFLLNVYPIVSVLASSQQPLSIQCLFHRISFSQQLAVTFYSMFIPSYQFQPVVSSHFLLNVYPIVSVLASSQQSLSTQCLFHRISFSQQLAVTFYSMFIPSYQFQPVVSSHFLFNVYSIVSVLASSQQSLSTQCLFHRISFSQQLAVTFYSMFIPSYQFQPVVSSHFLLNVYPIVSVLASSQQSLSTQCLFHRISFSQQLAVTFYSMFIPSYQFQPVVSSHFLLNVYPIVSVLASSQQSLSTQCLSHRISFSQQLAVTFYSMFIPSYQFQPVVSSHFLLNVYPIVSVLASSQQPLSIQCLFHRISFSQQLAVTFYSMFIPSYQFQPVVSSHFLLNVYPIVSVLASSQQSLSTQCLSHRISFSQQLAVTFYSMFIPSYQFQPVVSSHFLLNVYSIVSVLASSQQSLSTQCLFHRISFSQQLAVTFYSMFIPSYQFQPVVSSHFLLNVYSIVSVLASSQQSLSTQCLFHHISFSQQLAVTFYSMFIPSYQFQPVVSSHFLLNVYPIVSVLASSQQSLSTQCLFHRISFSQQLAVTFYSMFIPSYQFQPVVSSHFLLNVYPIVSVLASSQQSLSTQCLSHRISFSQQLAVTFYSMFIPSYQFQPVVSSHFLFNVYSIVSVLASSQQSLSIQCLFHRISFSQQLAVTFYSMFIPSYQFQPVVSSHFLLNVYSIVSVLASSQQSLSILDFKKSLNN